MYQEIQICMPDVRECATVATARERMHSAGPATSDPAAIVTTAASAPTLRPCSPQSAATKSFSDAAATLATSHLPYATNIAS